MEKEESHDENFKLDGVTVDEGIKELLPMYKVQAERSDTPVLKDHPVIARQGRIADNAQGLEGKIKEVLGSSVKADQGNAETIIKKLAYEVAQNEGFSGKPEELKDEQVRKYLAQVGSALGNPTIGNITEFTKSIMNLPAAKAGHPLYDANSPLAQLIQYIARQKDKEERRSEYLNNLIAEKWAMPGYAINMQERIKREFGIPLNRTATASEALGEINRNASLEAQAYANRTGKTYLEPKAQGKHSTAH